MIMCVLLCYPVSIRIYYQQGGLFLVLNLDLLTLKMLVSLCVKLKKLYLIKIYRFFGVELF